MSSASVVPLRIGLLGGAFDPPHLAHLALARAAVTQLRLDELRVVPTGQAWHKSGNLSAAEHRLAMVRLAFGSEPRVVVDDCELRRSGPSYTIDTLREFRARWAQAEFFLILGQDQARALPQWHAYPDILQLATLCVAVRAGAQGGELWPGTTPALGTHLHWLALPALTLSATQVRQRVAAHLSISELVFEPVARYIAHHHLYQATR